MTGDIGPRLDNFRRDSEHSRETHMLAQLWGPLCPACEGAGTVRVGWGAGGVEERDGCRRCGGAGKAG